MPSGRSTVPCSTDVDGEWSVGCSGLRASRRRSRKASRPMVSAAAATRTRVARAAEADLSRTAVTAPISPTPTNIATPTRGCFPATRPTTIVATSRPKAMLPSRTGLSAVPNCSMAQSLTARGVRSINWFPTATNGDAVDGISAVRSSPTDRPTAVATTAATADRRPRLSRSCLTTAIRRGRPDGLDRSTAQCPETSGRYLSPGAAAGNSSRPLDGQCGRVGQDSCDRRCSTRPAQAASTSRRQRLNAAASP